MPFYNSATVFGAPGEERFKRGNGESTGLDPLGVALRTVGYQQRQDGAFNLGGVSGEAERRQRRKQPEMHHTATSYIPLSPSFSTSVQFSRNGE